MSGTFETTDVLGLRYAELDYEGATGVICDWARGDGHHFVVVAPVNGLMLARRRADVGAAFAAADMITSDGVPIVWARRLMGRRDATRLYGPDLTLWVFEACERAGIPVALLGGRPERLDGLQQELSRRYPRLVVPYAWSPPFRDLGDDEIERIASEIRASGAKVIMVGIGCPKQELLMHRLSPLLPGVQLGVGAAFDFIPGYVRQAPPVLQRLGLEWAFRLACEPRRLWKRYITTNPPFVAALARQLIGFHARRVLGGAGAV